MQTWEAGEGDFIGGCCHYRRLYGGSRIEGDIEGQVGFGPEVMREKDIQMIIA